MCTVQFQGTSFTVLWHEWWLWSRTKDNLHKIMNMSKKKDYEYVSHKLLLPLNYQWLLMKVPMIKILQKGTWFGNNVSLNQVANPHVFCPTKRDKWETGEGVRARIKDREHLLMVISCSAFPKFSLSENYSSPIRVLNSSSQHFSCGNSSQRPGTYFISTPIPSLPHAS